MGKTADVVRRPRHKCKWDDAEARRINIAKPQELLPAAAVLLKAQLRGRPRGYRFALAGASIDQRWAYKMILMEYELDLLKQLKGAGERGHTYVHSTYALDWTAW
jgi:hypothetical protein